MTNAAIKGNSVEPAGYVFHDTINFSGFAKNGVTFLNIDDSICTLSQSDLHKSS
jgi:hypothetical protein